MGSLNSTGFECLAVTQRVRENEKLSEGEDGLVRERQESCGANLNTFLLVVLLMI